jgi:hypothetical protein
MTIEVENAYDFIENVTVTLVSPDPFFLTGNQALIGRDRFSRVDMIYENVAHIDTKRLSEQAYPVVIVDYGYTGAGAHDMHEISKLHARYPDLKIIGYVDEDNTHDDVVTLLNQDYLDALLYKHEVGPTTHLIIQAVYRTSHIVASKSMQHRDFIDPVYWDKFYFLSLSTPWDSELSTEVGLTEDQAQVFVLRVISGLDRPDIMHELDLGNREYTNHVTNIRAILELGNEDRDQGANITLLLFSELSKHWWVMRIAPDIER